MIFAAVELRSAAIDVTLSADRATIVATYRFAGPGLAPEFVLIRLPAQRIAGLAANEGRTTEATGLVRITARPDSAGAVVIRYEVRGTLDRIPLPVPSIATARGARTIEIRLEGLAPTVDLDDAFPRLKAEANHAVAVLANVPSVIRLPEPGRWSLIRTIDRLVIALVAAASLLWFVQFRRTRAPAA